nr:E3 ubiquitin-protein ligase At1g63170 [Ipomoea batatas]
MERPENHSNSEHTIDITSSSEASSSGISHDRSVNDFQQQQTEDQPSTSVTIPVYQRAFSSTTGSNTRNSSFVRRGNGRSRHRSPLNSGLWDFCRIGFNIILPLLYWRYRYRNQSSEQDSQQQQNSSRGDLSAGPPSSSRTSEGEGRRTTATSSRWGQSGGLPNARLKALVEYFKMALDCFFAVWFVVGNVWIFGGHSSSSEAPNMYRKTKAKRMEGAASEGGIVAAGTEKERMISGEDAVCCICLAKYVNNDELRELPCSHFFHKDCVDKWLKINNTCPLCKAEVGETLLGSLTEATANLHASSVF